MKHPVFVAGERWKRLATIGRPEVGTEMGARWVEFVFNPKTTFPPGARPIFWGLVT